MRHRKAGRKLGRTSSHLKATLRNLVTSLLEHEKIETTDAKAKELRKIADKMITLGKRGDLHARRQALSVIMSKKVVKKLFEEIAPRFQNRQGGYTRIMKVGRRLGDNAPVSIIELVGEGEAKKEKKKKAAGKKEKPGRKKGPKPQPGLKKGKAGEKAAAPEEGKAGETKD
ncbi:MAG TPA: 50S ribosomal protein L17 [Thermodesulfobacteriota bacterium]|nr:50S ribosomal protein L17 [Thermodesulfobacteriota bacterium]